LGLSSLYVQPELLGGNAAAQMLMALNGEKTQSDVSVEVGTWNLRHSVGKINPR
jgi:hypothetical protein